MPHSHDSFKKMGQRKKKEVTATVPFARECVERTFLRDPAKISSETEYIIRIEKMVILKGKKFASKRNLLRKFQSNNPHWRFEEMTTQNIDKGFVVERRWQNDSHLPQQQLEYMRRCFRYYSELELLGGVLFVADTPVAYGMVAPVGDWGCYLLGYRVLSEYAGCTTMFFAQLAQLLMDKYPQLVWLNLGDTPDIGQQKMVLSYRPEIIMTYETYCQQEKI